MKGTNFLEEKGNRFQVRRDKLHGQVYNYKDPFAHSDPAKVRNHRCRNRRQHMVGI